MKYITLRLKGAAWALLLSTLYFPLSLQSQALSGQYTIGITGGDYPTFRDAIAALDSFGVSDPVVFNIKSGVYYESDTIGPVKGASVDNTITFQSESRDSASVILEWNSQNSGDWNLRLNRAGFLIFKNIGFRQLFDGARQNVLLINCHNLRFEHCLFEGSNMVMDGTLLNGSIDSNLTLHACHFRYARKGLVLEGFKKHSAKAITLSKNQIRTQNIGISTTQTQDLKVENNQVSNISGGPFVGLLVKQALHAFVNANYIQVMANGRHSRAMDLQKIQGDSSALSIICNNVLDVQAQSGKHSATLKIGALENTLIAYNSLKMQSARPLEVVHFTPPPHSMPNALFCNNIIANTGRGSALNTFDFKLKSDYNLWYAADADAQSQAGSQPLGSQNQHSHFADPQFFDDALLYAEAIAMDSNAMPLSQIMYDFGGHKRNSTVPDIGAHERLALPVLDLPSQISACDETSITTKGQAAYYKWNTGSHGDSLYVTSSGTYWLTARNGDGETTDSTQVSIYHSPAFIINSSLHSLAVGQCVQLSTSLGHNTALNYEWKDDQGQSIAQEAMVQVCPAQLPTTYTVTVVNEHGCSHEESITLYQRLPGFATNRKPRKNHFGNNPQAVKKDGTAGQQQSASSSSLEPIVYPNPANDVLTVSFDAPLMDEAEMHLTDLAGNQIPATIKVLEEKKAYQITIDHLANGAYILVITKKGETFRKQVVKAGE